MNLISLVMLAGCALNASAMPAAATRMSVPPSWEVLPIPRYVDYGSRKAFVTAKNVAIVRREGGLYQTVRDKNAELVGQSTITEEELTSILREAGTNVKSVSDDQASYDGFDTLILLGNPQYNKLTEMYFNKMKFSFAKWDDPNTPEHDFNTWKDFGREGYMLKVGKWDGKNIIILAAYDKDDANPRFFPGAGTFYAMQSLRQLMVSDAGKVRIKVADIADKPLIQQRAAYAAFWPPPEQNQRNTAQLARMKANGSIYWYGDQVVGYNAQAASKFRYPWTQEQLDYFRKTGRWCREHFISLVFCMNPDHYNVDWAAAKTFDGSRKDPLHYNPAHPVEPQFRELWAKLGYEVTNDLDILAAKFTEINRALGGGATLQMMNEDDIFGLVHEEDKLYHTDTPDPKQNAVNYGKARAQFLISLYKRTREMSPSSSDVMPICPPDGVAYQTPLARNDFNSQDFMAAFSGTLKEVGLLDKMPVITSGGGTLAESISVKTIDDFKAWTSGASVALSENNFLIGRAGAFETNPKGPRWPLQKGDEYPAGYRDKQLYTRLWGVQWNMNGNHDVNVLAWTVSQFMWNMLALEKQKVDALAVRKVSTASSYPLVKSLFEEFDRPIAYTFDDATTKSVAITDGIALPREGLKHRVVYTGDLRKEAQRLRGKLSALLPQLEAKWEDRVEKRASLTRLGYDAFNFCCVYLARGYIKGWTKDIPEPAGKLTGARLRDLYMEAEDIDQRFFAGPGAASGRSYVDRDYFYSPFSRLYVATLQFPLPEAPSQSSFHVDIWKDGLLGRFFEPVTAVILSDLPEGDSRLIGAWSKVEEVDKEKFKPLTDPMQQNDLSRSEVKQAEKEKFRTVSGSATVKILAPSNARVLLRVKVGTSATSSADGYFRTVYTETANMTLAAGKAIREDAVCKPRWITWLLPANESFSGVTLKTDKPVRVYAVELYKEKKQ